MEIVIGYFIGLVVGWMFATKRSTKDYDGSLKIDTSDPDDGPYLFLELSKDVNYIYNKKYVKLIIDRKNFIPHE